jgi:predicted transposase/invertase (TIGR01784 family)
MKEKMISPLNDYVFSEIFGNQKNIDITRNFLKTLLDIPEDEYDTLTVVSPILRRLFRTEKTGVVDLKLTTKSGKIIHIELQVEKRTNLRSRILYYASRLIGDQLKWGDDYNELNQVISIVICDHNLLEEESSYINEYELRNKENRSFTKLLRMIIIELPKMPKAAIDNSVWPWLKFLKSTQEEEYEMLALRYPELEKPVFCAKRMSLFEKWRDIQFHKNLWKVDERNLFEQAKIDGHALGVAEGLAEGMTKNKLEIAKNALAKGLSVEMVHEITGLDIETVQQLNS